ncbi:MAG: YtxH domain-containing protein [Sulfurovaceae bacterium]|nr:YtxH domain-containing protein [Sulfurovaceae bacterium]
MNNNGLRNNSPMEQARQNSQRGFNSNPYINQNSNQNMGQNPYYNDNNSMNNQMPNQNPQQPSMMDSLYGSFDTSNFLKGAALGAIGAYLLTNENAQKTIFKGVAKGSEMFQAGIEEMKERFEDAKAEMDAEK